MPTPQTSPSRTAQDQAAQEQILTEFRAWMLNLSPEHLAHLGVEFSVEEPLRLLRGFASAKGLTLS